MVVQSVLTKLPSVALAVEDLAAGVAVVVEGES
jgi:hypothetical protein